MFENAGREGFSETFQEYFSAGTIDPIDQSAIPSNAMAFFEEKSRLFINRDTYRPNNFSAFFRIQHDDGDVTYVAQQRKTYNTNGDTEDLSYFFDVRDTDKTGHGELRLNLNRDIPFFCDKPFVGYTYTDDHFRKKGLGTRRLKMMNAFSRGRYGLPLYSSTTIRPRAESVWVRLAEQGKAKHFFEGEADRYVFVT